MKIELFGGLKLIEDKEFQELKTLWLKAAHFGMAYPWFPSERIVD